MKKIITVFAALIGVASADTILTFTGRDVGGVDYAAPEWSIDSYDAHNKGSGAVAGNLSDDTSFSLTWNAGGNTYLSPNSAEWSNTQALRDLNSVLGTELSATDIASVPKTCFGNNSTGNEILTLNFGSSSYSAGDTLTAYVLLGQYGNSMNSFAVTGLQDLQVSYATNIGDGFSSVASFSGQNAATLVKVTGILTDSPIVFTTNGHKVGYGMLATKFEAVPEPAAATMGLLAFAGLAARRRRK